MWRIWRHVKENKKSSRVRLSCWVRSFSRTHLFTRLETRLFLSRTWSRTYYTSRFATMFSAHPDTMKITAIEAIDSSSDKKCFELNMSGYIQQTLRCHCRGAVGKDMTCGGAILFWIGRPTDLFALIQLENPSTDFGRSKTLGNLWRMTRFKLCKNIRRTIECEL